MLGKIEAFVWQLAGSAWQVQRKWRNPTQSNFVYEKKAEEVFSLTDSTPPKHPITPVTSAPSPEKRKVEAKPVEVVQSCKAGRFAFFCHRWKPNSDKSNSVDPPAGGYRPEIPASAPPALGEVHVQSEISAESPTSSKGWYSKVSTMMSPNRVSTPKVYKAVGGGSQYHDKMDTLRSSLKSVEDPDEVFSL